MSKLVSISEVLKTIQMEANRTEQGNTGYVLWRLI